MLLRLILLQFLQPKNNFKRFRKKKKKKNSRKDVIASLIYRLPTACYKKCNCLGNSYFLLHSAFNKNHADLTQPELQG